MNGILLPVIAELGVKISVSCHQINCKRSSIENTHFSGDTKTDSRKIWLTVCSLLGFQGCTIVKNPSASVGDKGDYSSVPGLGRSLKEEMATRSSILV